MATTSCPVECACHDNPYNKCSEPGGCGSAGCGREEQGACPACRRRDPGYGLVCEPCRDWLPVALSTINTKYGDLPSVLVPGDNPDQKVTGSRDPAAPLNLDAEDLLTRVTRLGGIPVDVTRDTMTPATTLELVKVLMARFEPSETDHSWWEMNIFERRPLVDSEGLPVLQPARDQVGYLPVAQVLDAWARHWVIVRDMREHRPTPTVPTLTRWLADRLPWACDHYDAIGDFAASVRTIRGNLMAVLGEFDTPPQHCDGIPCNRCDRKELFFADDGSGDVICRNQNCLKVFRRPEFDAWKAHLDGYERSRRTPDQIRELLRRRTPAGAA